MAHNKNNVLEVFLAEKNWTETAWMALGISSVAVLMSLYHLFTAYYGEPTALAHRSPFLSFILILAFFLKPFRRQSWQAKPGWPFLVDLTLIALTILVQVYILWDIDGFQLRFGDPNLSDTVVGSIILLLVVEATPPHRGLAHGDHHPFLRGPYGLWKLFPRHPGEPAPRPGIFTPTPFSPTWDFIPCRSWSCPPT